MEASHLGSDADFTEAEYRALLRIAKTTWHFARYGEIAAPGRLTLWRHDLDYSVHRALALATIEHEEGVRATYFVLLHSPGYNVLEREIVEKIRRIAAMGHDIGLHFDAAFYAGQLDSRHAYDVCARRERDILETVTGIPVHAFSWHNPTTVEASVLRLEEIGGMSNAYSEAISARFSYVSDSNGVWRHRRLRDVLERAEEPSLQVLTHPEWWVPDPLPARDRIVRAARGRAEGMLGNYDRFLSLHGRPNEGAGKSL